MTRFPHTRARPASCMFGVRVAPGLPCPRSGLTRSPAQHASCTSSPHALCSMSHHASRGMAADAGAGATAGCPATARSGRPGSAPAQGRRGVPYDGGGPCKASIRARCSGPCPPVVAIHTSRAMHASRVRVSCASGGPLSGTSLWQTCQRGWPAHTLPSRWTRDPPLPHAPPLPCTAHSPTSHGVHTGCDDATTWRAPPHDPRTPPGYWTSHA